MAHTIRGFQEDMAAMLSEQIFNKTGEDISVERVQNVLWGLGVVNDHTYWRHLPTALNDLGFDYDEVIDVAP